MRLAACGASVRGPAHIQDGSPNQDALGIGGCNGGWYIAVADGLGSRPLSHVGSRKAVQLFAGLARLQRSLAPAEVGQLLSARWVAQFGSEYQRFETTCLWARVEAHGHGFAGQVGDGLMLCRSGGVFQVVTPAREGFGNQTYTLAQANSTTNTSTQFELSRPGDGILLLTDGISDDLIPEQLEPFFDAIYQRQRRSSRRRMRRWLTDELNGWSTPLHGDDKTIAGIFRLD
ncbi:PP2C family serine/threonine-protein phosphatase [Halopseudomonas sp.]|uniref:PP2C family serine/threonine-protein phosphatase n=1 Tax=Halopseudomonas sp. TaxID=2901191 RepID=UPI003003460C